MKAKRLVVLLLVGCMALSTMLSGCGKTADSEENTDKSSEEATKESDAEGLEEITITMMMAEPSTQEMPDTFPTLEAIKKKFNINVDLQIIPGADYPTKVATTLASNSMPDVMCGLTTAEVNQYARTGILLNLEEYKDYAPDYYGLIEAEDRAIEANKIRVDGNMYCFYTLEKYRIALGNFIGIRMDLLEEQGIAIPTTYEEYYDALLQLKEAYPDMYGFSSRAGTNYLIGAFAYSLGTGGFPSWDTERGMYYEPDTDSYVYGPTDEKFTRVVNFLRQAYADGILDPDYAVMDKDTMFEKLSSGQMMTVKDNNSFIARTYNPSLAQIDENAYFDILDPLVNEDGVARDFRPVKDWWDNVAVVSSQTKYPERVIEMLNWLYTEEGSLISNFGVEGEQYDMVDGKPVYKQELIDQYANADDVASAVLGSFGGGLLGFGLYVDESIYTQVSDPIYLENAERIDAWTEEGTVTYLGGWPPFTEEEQERVVEIEQKLSNVFNQEIDGFITGKTSMDEWPAFVEQLESQGTAELEEIFNAAYARIK